MSIYVADLHIFVDDRTIKNTKETMANSEEMQQIILEQEGKIDELKSRLSTLNEFQRKWDDYYRYTTEVEKMMNAYSMFSAAFAETTKSCIDHIGQAVKLLPGIEKGEIIARKLQENSVALTKTQNDYLAYEEWRNRVTETNQSTDEPGVIIRTTTTDVSVHYPKMQKGISWYAKKVVDAIESDHKSGAISHTDYAKLYHHLAKGVRMAKPEPPNMYIERTVLLKNLFHSTISSILTPEINSRRLILSETWKKKNGKGVADIKKIRLDSAIKYHRIMDTAIDKFSGEDGDELKTVKNDFIDRMVNIFSASGLQRDYLRTIFDNSVIDETMKNWLAFTYMIAGLSVDSHSYDVIPGTRFNPCVHATDNTMGARDFVDCKDRDKEFDPKNAFVSFMVVPGLLNCTMPLAAECVRFAIESDKVQLKYGVVSDFFDLTTDLNIGTRHYARILDDLTRL